MNTKQDIFELTADYFFQRSTAAENNAAGRGKSPFLTTLLRTGSPAESADKVENVFSIGKAIREGKPYPIKPEEAFEVVRVTEMVKKQNPAFKIKNDEFGK